MLLMSYVYFHSSALVEDTPSSLFSQFYSTLGPWDKIDGTGIYDGTDTVELGPL